MSWRDELRRAVEAIPDAELADGVGELARAQALLQQRIRPNGRPEVLKHFRAEEVADLLDVDRSWVYRHREQLGGVSIGGVVRFPEVELRRFLEARR